MTLKSIINGATPVVAGVAALALLIRYAGDAPGIKEVKEGLKGNVSGKLFS